MSQIYLTIDGDNLGPLSIEEVNAKLKSGEIKKTAKSWTQGMEGWLELSDDAFVKMGVVIPTEKATVPLSSESTFRGVAGEKTSDIEKANMTKSLSSESKSPMAKARSGKVDKDYDMIALEVGGRKLMFIRSFLIWPIWILVVTNAINNLIFGSGSLPQGWPSSRFVYGLANIGLTVAIALIWHLVINWVFKLIHKLMRKKSN